MIDFHSHIIYDVDDGSQSIENSIEILKIAEKAGFNEIILTPHYMPNYYEVSKNDIKNKIETIREECKKEKINVTLYQANEIYITSNMVELLQNQIATTINDSKYVLFELPINEEPANLLEVIYSLLENKKVPIIAHPERYSYIQEEPNKLLELIENGILFQTNYGSIAGQFGKDAEKTAKELLQNNFIHFLGSDVHRTGYIYSQIKEIENKLRKILPQEKIKELTQINPKKVINNEELEIEIPTKIKRGFFQKVFT